VKFRSLVPDSFSLVDDLGRPARDMRCPLCGGRLTIGFMVRPGDAGPARLTSAIHGTIDAEARTGCDTFDRLELEDFLVLVVPRLLIAAALGVPAVLWGRA